MAEPTQTPPVAPNPPVSGPLAALEKILHEWLVQKAPVQIPVAATDVIVKIMPWIILVGAVILIPFILTAISGVMFLSSVSAAYGVASAQPTFMLWLALAVLIVQTVIMFVSVPKLLKYQRSGWLLLFYADIFNVIYGVFNSLAYGYLAIAGIIWTLIAAVLTFYLLFQVRRYYNK